MQLDFRDDERTRWDRSECFYSIDVAFIGKEEKEGDWALASIRYKIDWNGLIAYQLTYTILLSSLFNQYN